MSTETQRLILSEHPLMSVAQLGNDGAQFGLFAGIFSTVEKALEGPAHFFVLPAALFSDVLRSILTLWEWFNARNKNFRRTTKLLLELIKTAVVGTAIIGTMAGCALIAAITPFLFVGALGCTTLYHLGMTIYHGYKWYKSSLEAAPHHKKLFLVNLWVTAALATLTAAVSVVLAFKPEIGIFKSLVSLAAVVTSSLSTVIFGAMGLKILWDRKKAHQVSVVQETPQPEIIKAPSINNVSAATPAPVKASVKLCHEDLVKQMNNSYDAEERKQFVLDVMHEKNQRLEAKKNRSSFFYEDQNLYKRQALTLLRLLVNHGEVKVCDRDEPIKKISDLIDHYDKKKMSNAIFHSFFREVGEMQKIFIMVDDYLDHRPQELAYSPKTTPSFHSASFTR